MRLPSSVQLDNRITAADAAKRYELPGGYKTLCRAIDAGVVRGERVEVGSRCIHLIDPAELEEDLSNLPLCGYCRKKPALAPSGACSGPHARALETKGTKLSAETCRRMSEGKKGKLRPDVRLRVAQMHADAEQHYRWNVALAEGRTRISTPEAAAMMKRRAKGRLGGLLAARERGIGAPTSRVDDEQLREVERLANRGWGRPAICEATGLTDWVVRKLLRELRKRTA